MNKISAVFAQTDTIWLQRCVKSYNSVNRDKQTDTLGYRDGLNIIKWFACKDRQFYIVKN